MKNLMEFTSLSPEETFDIGKKLGSGARSGDVFALKGELGSGKTVIAKGIASGLGIAEDVTSPTFTLLEIYEGNVRFYHFDLYRISDETEFDNLNFEDYWDNGGVSVIEWPERAGRRIPDNAVSIFIEYLNESERRILIEYSDDRRFD